MHDDQVPLESLQALPVGTRNHVGEMFPSSMKVSHVQLGTVISQQRYFLSAAGTVGLKWSMF